MLKTFMHFLLYFFFLVVNSTAESISLSKNLFTSKYKSNTRLSEILFYAFFSFFLAIFATLYKEKRKKG